jgi:hypothetical protein
MLRKFLIAGIFTIAGLVGYIAYTQQIPPVPKLAPAPAVAHGTGLVLPSLEKRRDLHKAEARRHAIHHAKLAMRLADPLSASYDCRQYCTPVKDQGSCGDCWLHSAVGCIESANIKNRNLPDNSSASQLSEQDVLDGCSVANGGCGGDDATTVFDYCKGGGGVPLTSVYGPYQGYAGNCSLTTTAVGYTISDYGYCGSAAGIAPSDAIKAAMLLYGPISVCIAADPQFENFSGNGVFTDSGFASINHQVILVGWDDTKGKHGAWLLRNSWGIGWADAGYCWIEYAANQVGTEAMWVIPGTPVVLQPSAPPNPGPSPTRRMVLLVKAWADIEAEAVEQYQHGTPEQKAQVLSLLGKMESDVPAAKKQLKLGK